MYIKYLSTPLFALVCMTCVRVSYPEQPNFQLLWCSYDNVTRRKRTILLTSRLLRYFPISGQGPKLLVHIDFSSLPYNDMRNPNSHTFFPILPSHIPKSQPIITIFISHCSPLHLLCHLPPFLDRRSQLIQHTDRARPVDARIGNTHTLLQPRLTLSRDILPSLAKVTLNHHTDNGRLPSTKLRGNITCHTWLILPSRTPISIYWG